MTTTLTLVDPALPALDVILAPERLSETLGVEVRPRRLRYKPGTSVVLAFDAAGESRWIAAYADPGKVRKTLDRAARAGRKAERLPDAVGVVTGEALADRELVGAVDRLAATHPALIDGARVLRHNPLRRLVLRCGDAVVKVAADAGHVPLDAVRRSAAPALLPTALSAHATTTPWWGDGDLSGCDDSAAEGRAAEALVALHHGDATAAPSVNPSTELDAALRALAAIAPDAADVARGIAARLDLSVGGDALLHGDFSADQVLSGGGGVRLIDFDRVQRGRVERDLGSFAADALARGRTGDALIEAYRDAGGVVDDRALRHWTAFAILLRAAEPFRRLDRDWPDAVAAGVRAAGEVLP